MVSLIILQGQAGAYIHGISLHVYSLRIHHAILPRYFHRGRVTVLAVVSDTSARIPYITLWLRHAVVPRNLGSNFVLASAAKRAVRTLELHIESVQFNFTVHRKAEFGVKLRL
jgi:hypothetical protein